MPILSLVQGFLASIGGTVIWLCQVTGSLSLFAASGVSHIFRPPWYPAEIARQLVRIGFYSLPVIGMTALFTGGALALQIYAGSSRFNAESFVPSIVAIGMTRELGPVLGGLMVAGRVSSSIAAELGTMRVTEQIDALTTLSTNPMKYLVAPRLLAATLALPLLAFVGDIIGIMGGHLVSTTRLGFNAATYIGTTWDFLQVGDITSGLIKAGVFGFIVALMGCYQGFHSGRGAQGVGHHQRGGHGLRADPGLELRSHRAPVPGMTSATDTPSDTPSETPKIELRGVRKSFGSNRVLRGVDLSVGKGESLVIIGGSGTGKSISIKCVIGLVRPDSGEIRVDGQDVSKLGGSAREEMLDRFGMLFQGGALFDSLLVWQNVAFRHLHGQRKLPKAEARDVAIEKLRRVGLGEQTADLYPAELSGGMQKRVGLARAICAEPEIIFFDEPTTGLDPIMSDVINDLIRELVSELGATAVTITHDMRSVRRIADTVAMIHEGVIQWSGPVGEIDTADNPYVHQFVNGLPEGPIAAIR